MKVGITSKEILDLYDESDYKLDIVFVAVPLSEETEDNINSSIIQRGKKRLL